MADLLPANVSKYPKAPHKYVFEEDKYTELGVLVFHPTKREQAVALANARKDCDKLWNLIFGCNVDIINEKKNILSGRSRTKS